MSSTPIPAATARGVDDGMVGAGSSPRFATDLGLLAPAPAVSEVGA